MTLPHMQVCWSIIMRTLIDIMLYHCQCPNVNHQSLMPNPKPKLGLILTLTLKACPSPQKPFESVSTDRNVCVSGVYLHNV